MAEPHELVVAAIDFGTTYSGYAFALKDDPERKLYVNHFVAGGGRGLLSYKTPTTVLLDSRKQFKAFGYEAEDQYAELAEADDHESYYYFRRFKMMLFKNTKLNRKTVIHDINNKPMPALTIFAMGIKYLKSELKKMLDTQGLHVSDSEIHWVLTVPAIWNDPAKQFMREAAEEARIDGSQLTIALEPEAASLFCKHIPVEKLCAGQEGIRPFSPGNKYLVLDAGGGTVDITVHEVKYDGSLMELHKASGGAWGGTKVDEEYKSLLASFTGQESMDKFCTKCTAEFIELYREFETKKRSVDCEKSNSKVTIRVPVQLKETYEEIHHSAIEDAIERSPVKHELIWKRDKLQMGPSVFARMFKSTCDDIVAHIRKLLSKQEVVGTSTIIMVGGFSESQILQKKIRESFPSLRIIIPQDAGLAVLKGAVLYGLEPTTIASRIAKYTYGIESMTNFNPKIHDIGKQRLVEGVLKCDNVFSKHVEKGQVLVLDEAQAEKSYGPSSSDQTQLRFSVYTSSEKDPMYTTDRKCRYVGSMTMDIPDTTGGKQRSVTARMIFGGTEIKVEAKNENTGKITSAKFNFLEGD